MKKVITYGTFDLFHQGHYNILKRAKEYGEYLIVGITGENYDIGRGKLSVHDTLATRIENVRATGLADEIIVEEYLGQKIGDIIKYDIDTFVIGDDWKGTFDHLSRYCNMVYLERTKGISSTQIRQETFKQYDIGIVADVSNDNQLVKEALLVNGFCVKNLFAENSQISASFDKYNIENVCASYEELVEKSDIVYVRCTIDKRYQLIKQALLSGKHVIYDSPVGFNTDELEELFAISKKNKVILMENIKMVHIYVFNQLLWHTQGGLIGDILSINASISKNDSSRSNLFFDLSALALLPMLKIMGLNFEKSDYIVKRDADNIEFASMNFVYPNGRAVINVGNSVRVDNHLEIIGSKGTIRMKGNWWRSKSFELHRPETDEVQIFNTNFEGNGFKYLVKAMATMLENDRIDTMGVFKDESLKMVEILEQVSKS